MQGRAQNNGGWGNGAAFPPQHVSYAAGNVIRLVTRKARRYTVCVRILKYKYGSIFEDSVWTLEVVHHY